MLPNIELDSGATVAVDLDYTPAAAEIVTPMEGNLALAVKSVHAGDPWSPDVMVAGYPESGKWSVYIDDGTVEVMGGLATLVGGAMNNSAHLLATITELPVVMKLLFSVSSGAISSASAYVEDAHDTRTNALTLNDDGVISGEFDLSGLAEGPYDVIIELGWQFSTPVSFTAPLDTIPQQSVTLSAAMRAGQIAGTRGAREDNTVFTGLLPDGITLFPLDPARYGHGNAGQRIGLLEFTGAGAADVRAAIVRWRDPS